jgi:hypothetical protein
MQPYRTRERLEGKVYQSRKTGRESDNGRQQRVRERKKADRIRERLKVKRKVQESRQTGLEKGWKER